MFVISIKEGTNNKIYIYILIINILIIYMYIIIKQS